MLNLKGKAHFILFCFSQKGKVHLQGKAPFQHTFAGAVRFNTENQKNKNCLGWGGLEFVAARKVSPT